MAAAAGRFAEAASHFEHVVAAHPGDPAALVARGWCRLESGELQLGYADLRDAFERRPTGRCAAVLGYATLRLALDLRLARSRFEEAIAKGYETAAVRNDAGYCCVQLSDFKAAAAHLAEAVATDPTCVQAHHNLAMLDLRQSVRRGRPLDLGHIRSALSSGPHSPGLLLDAAYVFAVACAAGTECETEAIRCCEQAITHGVEPERCVALIGRQCPALADRDDFRRLIRLPRPSRAVPEEELGLSRIAPPVDDLREFVSLL